MMDARVLVTGATGISWRTDRDKTGASSAHLKNRTETGEVLRASAIPVIEFRASIVIGTGSLSFEMIQALVERLPLMVCPRWVATCPLCGSYW
jgi:uncharacterized protein YbjT (DUF2867 family)